MFRCCLDASQVMVPSHPKPVAKQVQQISTPMRAWTVEKKDSADGENRIVKIPQFVAPPSGRLRPAKATLEPPVFDDSTKEPSIDPNELREWKPPVEIRGRNGVTYRDTLVASAITEAVKRRSIPVKMLPKALPMLEYNYNDPEYCKFLEKKKSET